MGHKNIGMILFVVGVIIVVATHLMILTSGLSQTSLDAHAMINLVAAAMILAGYFIGKR